VPELRTYGDLDVLIRPEDRADSHRLMTELGYSVKTDWEPVYTYLRNNEVVEIHSRMMEVDISEEINLVAYFSGAWEHARRMEGNTYEPQPEYHFLYLLAHIAKHIYGAGAGLRMYLDLALMIRHFGDRLNWAQVAGELRTMKLAQFANTALWLVQRELGVESPIPLAPLEEQTYASFVRFTLEGGLFGRETADKGTLALRNDDRTGETVSKAATLRRRLLPSAETLKPRYTYLAEKPWLLPAAWIHRLFLTRKTFREHAQEAGEILNADEAQAMRLRKMYRDIGL